MYGIMDGQTYGNKDGHTYGNMNGNKDDNRTDIRTECCTFNCMVATKDS